MNIAGVPIAEGNIGLSVRLKVGGLIGDRRELFRAFQATEKRSPGNYVPGLPAICAFWRFTSAISIRP
jgi:hypothetical protein